MSFQATHLIGFGARRAAAGGFVTDIHLPSGVTALLRAGFSVNEATFDTNSVSAAEVGSVTWNASGGAGNGAYVSGLTFGTNYYSVSAIDTGHASTFITCFAWVKTSNTGAALGSNYGPRITVFGDNNAAVSWQAGISDGKMHLAVGAATQGVTTVADGNWHLLCWQQTAQGTWNMWYDKVKDVSGATSASGNWSFSRIRVIGYGYPYSGCDSPTAMDGIQIFQGTISDSQVQEVYTNAGF